MKISFFKTLIIILSVLGVLITARALWMPQPQNEIQSKNALTFTLVEKKSSVSKPKVVHKSIPEAKNKSKFQTVVYKKRAPKTTKKIQRVVQLSNPKRIQYKIQPGDTLQKISMHFYQTHHKHGLITKANPSLNPNNLKVGTAIIIPSLKLEKSLNEEKVLLQYEQNGTRPYVIKEREVLSEISMRELGSMHYVKRILEVNPGLKPHKIRVGQKINLPIIIKTKEKIQ